MLQDVCKSCSRVLLDETDRRKFLKAFRRPHLENLKRQKLAKEVNTLARKVVFCPYCGEINGTVKKAGGMKIIHEKWRAKKVASDRKEFEATFGRAIMENKELKTQLARAQDDLNPLKVVKLFKAISSEVSLLRGWRRHSSLKRTVNCSAWIQKSDDLKNSFGPTSRSHQSAFDHLWRKNKQRKWRAPFML
jgi:DNA-directed RNA polymerase III subunit RPC1